MECVTDSIKKCAKWKRTEFGWDRKRRRHLHPKNQIYVCPVPRTQHSIHYVCACSCRYDSSDGSVCAVCVPAFAFAFSLANNNNKRNFSENNDQALAARATPNPHNISIAASPPPPHPPALQSNALQKTNSDTYTHTLGQIEWETERAERESASR